MTRFALVAGGGAVKGYAFHVGVAQAMEQDGYHFRSGLRWNPSEAPPGKREVSLYVGSSAGACVVASLASGHPVAHLRDAIRGRSREVPTFRYRVLFVPVAPNPVRYVGRLMRRLRLGQLRPHHLLDVGGVMTTAGVERYFRRNVLPTNRFGDLAAELYVAATQVNGARKVVFGPLDSMGEQGAYDASRAYYDNVPISQALAAAVAIPPLFAPYAITNPSSGKRFHYYDGEVREALSTHVARDAGADFIVASSIWRPYRYDERVGTLADLGVSALTEQAIHQAMGEKVDRDRRSARVHEQVLELIDGLAARGELSPQAGQELDAQVRGLLGRPVPTLYVTPTDEDQSFFFESSFRFNRRSIDRCIEAGQQAYRAAQRSRAPTVSAASSN